MFGMYSIAGVSLRCEHPVRREAASAASAPTARNTRAGAIPPRRALDTDHLHVDGARPAQDSEYPFLVPLRAVFRYVKPESVVREVSVQDRPLQVWEAAGQDQRGERHGPAQEHS